MGDGCLEGLNLEVMGNLKEGIGLFPADCNLGNEINGNKGTGKPLPEAFWV